MQPYDFHIHSTFSDGFYTPTQIIQIAKTNGLKAIAITDHDNLDQNEEAQKAGEKNAIQIIPGVELSTFHKSHHFHLLAYHISPNGTLDQKIQAIKNGRKKRNAQIINKLRELEFKVSSEDIECLATGNAGRPHIAQATINDPENKQLLERHNITTYSQFITTFLVKGAPAYFDRFRINAQTLISLIHAENGLAVFAHPLHTFSNKIHQIADFTKELKEIGLDGFETFYGKNEYWQTHLSSLIALNFNLIRTAGSDFHNPDPTRKSYLGGWNNYEFEENFSKILR